MIIVETAYILIFLSYTLFSSSFSFCDSQSLEISPEYEGLYSLNIRCPDSASTPFCKKFDKETYTMILSSLHRIANTSISIVKDSIGLPVYLFGVTEVLDLGQRLQGNSSGKMNSYSEIELSLDSDGTSISGYLRDPRHTLDLKFSGKPTHKLANLLSKPKFNEPLSPVEAVGVYEGTASSTSHHILSIYPSATQPTLIFYAQLIDKDTGVTMEFIMDHFISNKRRLTLLAYSTTFGEAAPLKWTLDFDRNSNGDTLINGYAVSALNGAHYEIHFKKR